jgi:nucleoside 2-deoxyribosyltransferase
MKKIYIAGPEVFLPNAREYYQKLRALAAGSQFQILTPLDQQLTFPDAIAQANRQLIDDCDIVIASCNPFRGVEPDSGTAFEVGYAAALKREIFLCVEDTKSVLQKTKQYFRIEDSWQGTAGWMTFPDGLGAENFGHPLNLMLMYSGTLVRGTHYDALTALVKGHLTA